MTATKRRTRRDRPAPAAQPASAAQPGRPAVPEWKWRTFPVYLALSFGLFAGMYMGIVYSWLVDKEYSVAATLVLIVPATLLGLGLARVTRRWLITSNRVKPRAKRVK